MNFLFRLLAGIKAELKAILRVRIHLGPRCWLVFVALLAGCLVGFLGGVLGVIHQGAVLLVLAGLGLFSGYLAHKLRQGHWVHFADGEEVAPFLPQFVTLLVTPLFFLAMFVEFKVLADTYPEVLPARGATGALWLVVENLSRSQLSFGFFQAFQIDFVPPLGHLPGSYLVLLTRVLMDLVFIKFLIQVGHAAWFRARGLGRGQDLLYQVHRALHEQDAGLVQIRARALRASLLTSIESLVHAVEHRVHHAAEAWHALVTMQPVALPALENGAEALAGEARTRRLELAERLRATSVGPAKEGNASVRAGPLLRMVLLLLLGTVAPLCLPGLPALLTALMMTGLLAWIIIGVRGWLDRLVAWKVLEPLAPQRLPWAIGLTALLLLPMLVTVEAVVLQAAAEVVPGLFSNPREDVTRAATAGFVLKQLLGPCLLPSQVAPLSTAHPLGMGLGWMVRLIFDIGIISIVSSFFGIVLNRWWRRFPVTPHAELALRTEARVCGPHAALLINSYYQEISDYLIGCFHKLHKDMDLYAALAASGFLRSAQGRQALDPPPGQEERRSAIRRHLTLGERLRDRMRCHVEAAWELETCLRLLGDARPGNAVETRETRCLAHSHLALARWSLARPREAFALADQAVHEAESLLAEGHAAEVAAGWAYYIRGVSRKTLGDASAAADDQLLAQKRYHRARIGGAAGLERWWAWNLSDLASAYASCGRVLDAIKEAEAGAAYLESVIAKGRLDLRELLALAENNTGAYYIMLGRVDQARLHYQKSLGLLRNLRREGEFQNETIEAISHLNMGASLESDGLLEAAVKEYQAALTAQQRLIRAGELELRSDYAGVLASLASVLCEQGKIAEAAVVAQQGVAIRQRLLEQEGQEYLRRLLARSLESLANPLWRAGQLAQAEQLYTQVIALYQQAGGPESYVSLLGARRNLAGVLRDLGKTAEAIALARQCLQETEGLLEENRPDLRPYHALALTNLGWALQYGGEHGSSLAYFTQAESLYRSLVGEGQTHQRRNLASTLQGHAIGLYNVGKLEAARQTVGQAIVGFNQLIAQGYRQFLRDRTDAINTLGMILRDLGQPLKAEALLRRGIHILDGLNRPDLLWNRLYMRGEWGVCLHGLRRVEEAVTVYREAIQGLQALNRAELRPLALRFEGALSTALQELGRYPEALATVDEVIAGYQEEVDRGRAELRLSLHAQHFNRAAILREMGRPQEALAALQEPQRFYEAQVGAGRTELRVSLIALHGAVALCRRALGQLREALEAADQALAIHHQEVTTRAEQRFTLHNTESLRGILLRDLQRYPEALEAFQAILPRVRDFIRAGRREYEIVLAGLLDNLALTYKEMGRAAPAREAFAEADALYVKLVDRDGLSAFKPALLINRCGLAMCLRDVGHKQQALDLLEATLPHMGALIQAGNRSLLARYGQGKAYRGVLYKEMQRNAEACQELQETLQLIQDMKGQGITQVWTLEAGLHGHLGALYQAEGRIDDARSTIVNGLALFGLRRPCQFTGIVVGLANVAALSDLVVTMAALLQKTAQDAEALALLQDFAQWLGPQVQEGDSVARTLAAVQTALGQALAAQNRHAEALVPLDQGRSIYLRLHDGGQASVTALLAAVLSNEGVTLNALKRHAEALECHRQALALYDQLQGDGNDQHVNLAIMHQNLAESFYAQGSHDAAASECRLTIALMESLPGGERHKLRSACALTMNCLGNILLETTRVTESVPWYEKACTLYDDLVREGHVQYLPSLGTTWRNKAQALFQVREYEQAKPSYQAALDCFAELVARNQPGRRADLASTHNALGNVYFAQARFAEAAPAYEAAIALYQALVQEGSKAERAMLAIAQENLGRSRQALAEFPAAMRALSRALAVRQELAREGDPNADEATATKLLEDLRAQMPLAA